MALSGTLTRKRIITAALILVVAVVSVVAITGQTEARDDQSGVRNPADLTNCFAFGIDSIGRGDFDGGVELWENCFTDDYSFVFTFFPGGPSIVCPGPDCPIQEFDSRAEMRALFVASNFEMSGYLATQHQMLNVEVRNRHRNHAEVFAYIQANHFPADDSVDIFWGDYTIDAVKQRGRWLVQSEEIVGTSFMKFEGVPPF